MSTDFIARLIGMVVFALLGVYGGGWLGKDFADQQIIYILAIGLVGALFGLVMTPYLTTRPMRSLRARYWANNPQKRCSPA